MPDAIIAASALIHNLTLLTRNDSDFKKIPNINIINPWEPPLTLGLKEKLGY
jgi:predicted nucleic acid-binding protein